MKKKTKIDWFKLISALIGIALVIYAGICIIGYTVKSTKQVMEYQPVEREIIVHN